MSPHSLVAAAAIIPFAKRLYAYYNSQTYAAEKGLEPVFTRRKERGKIEIWKKKDGSRTLAT